MQLVYSTYTPGEDKASEPWSVRLEDSFRPWHDEQNSRGRDRLRKESGRPGVLTPRTPCTFLILGHCRIVVFRV